jgi:hypothetical protein
MNIWYTKTDNTYHVQHEGNHYTRTSFVTAKELIESLMPNMVATALYS